MVVPVLHGRLMVVLALANSVTFSVTCGSDAVIVIEGFKWIATKGSTVIGDKNRFRYLHPFRQLRR